MKKVIIGNTTVIIHKEELSRNRLEMIYDRCNELFKEEKYYYKKRGS